MVQPPEEELLATCFQEVTGLFPSSIAPLRPHASERRIYRLSNGETKMVGVANQSRVENDAFVALAQHFRGIGLPVPEIHVYKPDYGVYLEEDLGETTLLDFLNAERVRTGEPFPASVKCSPISPDFRSKLPPSSTSHCAYLPTTSSQRPSRTT